MWKSLTGSIALVAFAAIGSAGAADLPVKAPMAPPLPTWSGCYMGGFGGGATSSNVDVTSPGDTVTGAFYNPPGAAYSYSTGPSFIAGGTLGCNWQQPGLGLVIGMEGEAGYLHLSKGVVDPNSIARFGSDTLDTTTIGDWYGVVAARFGWAYGPALFYTKAGIVMTPVNSTVVDTCTAAPCGTGTLNATGNAPFAGWTAGAGIEYMFAPRWSVKAEYLYFGLNTQTYQVCGAGGGTAAGASFCGNHTLTGVSTGKLGVNFYF
jgi:outer membrane immunogenic protein